MLHDEVSVAVSLIESFGPSEPHSAIDLEIGLEKVDGDVNWVRRDIGA